MKFFKKHWKTFLIVILAIMFMSKCTSSGNFERKYEKQCEYTVYVADSLENMYMNSANVIRDLNDSIKTLNNEKEILVVKNAALENKVEIYSKQVGELNRQMNKLAGKNTTVVVNNTEKEKDKE